MMARRTSLIDISINEIITKIRNGDRVMLGRAITLVESKHPKHQSKGTELINTLLKEPYDSFRVAISGSPGVGKSSFIEALGIQLVEQGHRVAVLSIDPSSDINKGSILGDKTRMERLSIHKSAFIRPSPAGEFLGGIAWRTREAITICEAAGFDVILVETVGVGQSEFKVKEMVDCFFLLLSPGGGDELQGIKKGIVEIADIITINKCDGDLEQIAMHTQKEYSQALHLSSAKDSGWNAKVITTSSETGHGISEAWELMQGYKKLITTNGSLERMRNSQNVIWFKERMARSIYEYIQTKMESGDLAHIQDRIIQGSISPLEAADRIAKELLR